LYYDDFATTDINADTKGQPMTTVTSSADLISKLRRVLLKQRMVWFGAGLVTTLAALAAAWVILSVVAGVMVVPVWLKIALLAGAGAGTVYVFVRLAVGRLLGGSVDQVAVGLEQKHPELKGRLVAALQFSRTRQRYGYSADLMEATLRQAMERSRDVNFNEYVSLFTLWRSARLLGAAAVVAVALLVAVPGLYTHSLAVYSNPTTEIAPPLGYHVVPDPGSIEWVKYRDITIGAAIYGTGLPDQAKIFYRLAGGSWQVTKVDLADTRHFLHEGGDSVHVTTTLRQVNKSFDYYVQAGRVTTDIQQVEVVDRPRVTGMKLSIFPPEYTGLPPSIIDENTGSFSAIVGSRVSMQIETNLPVVYGELVFSDTAAGNQPLKVSPQHLETSLRVDESQSYHVRLRDHLGEENPDPIEYYVTAIPDEYPSVDVLVPGFNVNLTDEMVLPLKVRIFDDFGFSSLVLKYKVVSQGRASDENVVVLHFSDRIKTEGDIQFTWDLDPLNLFPGDYVVYQFEVADNDNISGPKLTTSRTYIARLPSLDEIIADVEQESQGRINKAEDLFRSARELNERLQNVARKLEAQKKQSQQSSEWQQQKELESILQKNDEVLQQVQKLSEQMDQSLEKIQENALLSRQIMEKLQQIQKLFEDVATPEMREAQEKLMEALKNMDRQQLDQAMKEFEMGQEEFLNRLERTLALLKRMQVEQKMEAMIRKAEEILEQQENVNQTTDSADADQLPDLSRAEQDNQQALEQLKQEVADLKALAKEAQMENSEALRQFSEAVERTDADQNMQQMTQHLQQSERQQASQEGTRAQSKLIQMLDDMQQQLLAMTGGDQDKAMQQMRTALRDANYLSNEQEKLLKEAAVMDQRSSMLRELAPRQQDLISSCNGLQNRLQELGKESPFVAMEIQKLVSDAVAQMKLAMEGLDGARGSSAQRSQQQAMSQLNRASLRLLESMEQQRECNKGSNCNKSMSQLESLCNKQNQLNQQTQQQCNNPGNSSMGSTGEQQMRTGESGFERLAGEQGAIRKSLEQLANEFGDSRQIMGRLDDIAREMKEVEEALAEGNVGDETLERQLKVYSRMLQATRSLQRKDFSEQRKAESATETQVFMPPALPADLLQDRGQLEDRLNRYLGTDYPEQYERQIKAYFKALLNLEAGQGTSSGNGDR
jgi:hypothetical protein